MFKMNQFAEKCSPRLAAFTVFALVGFSSLDHEPKVKNYVLAPWLRSHHSLLSEYFAVMGYFDLIFSPKAHFLQCRICTHLWGNEVISLHQIQLR